MRREVEIFQAALVSDQAESARLMADLSDDQLYELMRVASEMSDGARQVLVSRGYQEHRDAEAGEET